MTSVGCDHAEKNGQRFIIASRTGVLPMSTERIMMNEHWCSSARSNPGSLTGRDTSPGTRMRLETLRGCRPAALWATRAVSTEKHDLTGPGLFHGSYR